MLHQLPRWANTSKYYGGLSQTTGVVGMEASQATAAAARYLAGWSAAGGRATGLQASIMLDDHAGRQIDINQVLGGTEGLSPSRLALREEISSLFLSKFAFSPGRERFSPMLLSAALATSARDDMRSIARDHLNYFVGADISGLYGFFDNSAFAGDIDCTAAATKARLVTSDIDLDAQGGRAELSRLVKVILESAATQDLSADDNLSHGKTNGALTRHVFKVYLDNHERHGPEFDRGLKNNPVVAAQALYPVLVALAAGVYAADDLIDLKEFRAGEANPFRETTTVGEIIDANVSYIVHHLAAGDFEQGCRYYRSPDVFLYFLAEAVRDFPAAFEGHDMKALITAGGAARRAYVGTDTALYPHSSLNSAFRAMSLLSVGANADIEIKRVLSRQLNEGSWGDVDVLYSLGENSRVAFRSSILTTAFCLKALEHWSAAHRR